MKKFPFILHMLFLLCLCVATSFKAQSGDKEVPSGFYRVLKTEDAKNSFLLQRDQIYYTLYEETFLPLASVDSVYEEYANGSISVIIAFKSGEKNTLHSFSKENKNQEIGLVVNGELLLVALIVEPIAYGKISYSGVFERAHVKHIIDAVNYELKQQKAK